MGALWRASVWHPLAIPLDEWKFRNLTRVWLPFYYLIALFSGVQAIYFGSPLMNRLFVDSFVDFIAVMFALVALATLISVAFPRLWLPEIISTLVLVGLVTAYVAAILIFSRTPEPNFFVVGMLTWGLPFAFFRLNLLGEEIKERRDHVGEAADG